MVAEVVGIPTDAPNLAWSYELVTPERGILLGESETIEVGFELLMAEAGDQVVGEAVAARFGPCFPIRFGPDASLRLTRALGGFPES